ncbi:MAG: 3-phosphoserine/phosphohydroxythreonine transaminase [Myxococcota bacterium]
MTKDVVNFNAGPAGLPRAALERAQKELLDFEGTGISVMEHSHRGKHYEAVHREATALTKELLQVPDTHDILFLQGGASQLFATVPMNFLQKDGSADYIITGTWSKKAIAEAKLFGKTRVAGKGGEGETFTRIPKQSELDLDPSANYVHLTTNNTIAGTQWQSMPDVGKVPLVADMSSDIMWKPIDVSKFALIYAGAQKNIGPSGVVLTIIEKSWMEKARADIPTIFKFKTHAENESLYNTPPTFSIYMIRNVLAVLKGEGGLSAIETKNRKKSTLLYGAIDGSNGFYRSPVERDARSHMNVVWRLPTEALEEQFVKEATAKDMIGLKGHRSVGGVRASIYNAVSVAGVERLVAFMQDFAKKNG